ncbi:hypothetical protein NGRA_3408 [Nosema granulosis]|uniref:Uncharacterized protein n=1 Tax=Nosema granulosis TaxID=83296 RepID=A0A9P6GUT1_9MICR|nr:hypothetical protein NGRA_3408 [Nosema granulosis]
MENDHVPRKKNGEKQSTSLSTGKEIAKLSVASRTNRSTHTTMLQKKYKISRRIFKTVQKRMKKITEMKLRSTSKLIQNNFSVSYRAKKSRSVIGPHEIDISELETD